MKIKKGKGATRFGPGVDILLDGDEIATAILAFLVAHGIFVSGPRTVVVNDELCRHGRVYVDPEGFVVKKGIKVSGRTGEPL